MIKAEFELWKDIEEFEGYYQVSTWARVRSLDRWVTYKDGRSRLCKSFILPLRKNHKGYLRANLSKNGKTKRVFVHKLVAEAFIPNPLNLPVVNHKDEVKDNNYPYNLEWCTDDYNRHYGTAINRMQLSLTNRKDCSKPVYKYDLQGNLIYKYMSMMSAERDGFIRGSIRYSISKNKPYKGYIWSYTEINQELQ